MNFLHFGFLLPFFSLFEPFPFAPGLSLDEAFVLAMLPIALMLTPWRAIKPVYMILALTTLICIFNLSVFIFPKNFAIQFVNVFSYFAYFLLAFERVGFSLEQTVSSYFSVLKFYLVVGFLQIPWYYVDPNSLIAVFSFLGQSNTAGTGILGIRFMSLLQEPSHFVQFAAFGYTYLFFAWLNGGGMRAFFGLLVVGFAIVLSRSALAAAPLLLPFIVVALRYLFTGKGAIIVIVACLAIIAELAFGIIPEQINQRIVDLVAGILESEPKLDVNASSGSLLHALDVARQTLLNTYGGGIGFGAYQEAFLRYTPPELADRFYNSVSGGSLLIRITTEFGLSGILIWLSAILFKLPLNTRRNGRMIAFRWGCLAVLLTSMARLGGYTTGIFPFALLGYFFWRRFVSFKFPRESQPYLSGRRLEV